MMTKKYLLFPLLFILLVGFLSPAQAQENLPAFSPHTPAPLTPADVTQFTDTFLLEGMAEGNVPGVGIAIVQNDSILLNKGYGNATVNPTISVTADTPFRAGSVSKLLVATAVMQLVEQGKLDLRADVNTYLTTFQLETNYPQPVTVADLLLHTAGFDDKFLHSHARTLAEGQPLAEYLAGNFPAQTAPAGEFIAYNNFTISLAAHLIELVTGLSFEQYTDQYIFQPLAMNNSTFAQPVPDHIRMALATGYEMDGDTLQPFTLDYVNIAPAAALVTTPNDMARFMQAHLSQDSALMQPATYSDMHTTHFRHHELLRGRAYGFSEQFVNGQRVIYHDGGNPGFVNRLMLIPDAGIGFFITLNMDQYETGGRLHRQFTTAFFDRYFPNEDNFTPAKPQLTIDPSQYTGYYREMQNYSSTTIQKLDSLMNQVAITSDNAGNLHLFGDTLIPIEEDLFQWATDPNYVAFWTDNAGNVTHLFVGTSAFVKLSGVESQPVQLALVVFFLLTFAVALLISFTGKVQLDGKARLLLGGSALLNLVFLLLFAGILAQLDVWAFAYGIPAHVKGLLLMPLVSIAGILALVGFTARTWRHTPLPTRLTLTVTFVIWCGYFVFLNHWQMLGWQA